MKFHYDLESPCTSKSFWERMTLTNTGEEYHLFEHDTRLIYVFEQTTEIKFRLKEVRNEQDHHIQFAYNLKGFLSQVTDRGNVGKSKKWITY